MSFYYRIGWPHPGKLCVDLVRASDGGMLRNRCHFKPDEHWQKSWMDIYVTQPFKVIIIHFLGFYASTSNLELQFHFSLLEDS